MKRILRQLVKKDTYHMVWKSLKINIKSELWIWKLKVLTQVFWLVSEFIRTILPESTQFLYGLAPKYVNLSIFIGSIKMTLGLHFENQLF